MGSRKPLRKQIISAWHTVIEEIYPQQLINSERGLQVHFCHALLASFKEAGVERRIFVEPRFVNHAGEVRSPDIVICHTKEIIGVIELKYGPKVTAQFEKDLETLAMFNDEKNEFTLSNDRYFGKSDKAPKNYTLATDAVLCWAGVYKGPKVDVEGKGRALADRLMCLHAVTAQREFPALFSSTDSNIPAGQLGQPNSKGQAYAEK